MYTTRRAWAVFLGFFLLMAAWALASPIDSGPDEPSHVIKAAATVRLEFDGPHYLIKPVEANQAPQIMTVFRVPRGYAVPTTPCFAYRTAVTARCEPRLDSSAVDGRAATYVGGYNPTYYFLVGWPSLLVQGDASVYLMRLCSALVSAALIGLAALTVLQSTRHRGPMLGLLAAATPMVVYLGGVVNPNGTEAGSAILAWTSLNALATAPRGTSDRTTLRRLAVRAAIGMTLLASIRPLGPLWVACAVAAAALIASPATRRAVAASRAARWGGLAALAAIGAAGLWTLSVKLPLATEQIPKWTFARAAQAAVLTTNWYLHEMIGVFGWLDTPAPAMTIVLAAAVLAVLIVPALSRPRFGPVLAALLVATLLVPIVAMGQEAHTFGLQWQGRYILAFAVGIPIIAGWARVGARRESGLRGSSLQNSGLREVGLREVGLRDAGLHGSGLRSDGPRYDASLSRATVCWCLWLTAAAGFAAFWWAMLRYAIGTRPSVLPTHALWTPPLGWATVLGLYMVGALLIVAGAWPERSAPAAGPRTNPVRTAARLLRGWTALAVDDDAAELSPAATRPEPTSASASASASPSSVPAQSGDREQDQDILAGR